jgi:hypothetical protein
MRARRHSSPTLAAARLHRQPVSPVPSAAARPASGALFCWSLEIRGARGPGRHPDSEQFRSPHKTPWPLYGRLSADEVIE